MKKTLFAVMLLLSVHICKSQVIGKLSNGIPEFTVNKEEIIKNFENNLSELSKIQALFSKVDIVQRNEEYYLIFSGDVYTSKIPLEVDRKMYLVAGKIACTITSCATTEGCLPNFWNTSCSACEDGKKDCTKTVSSGYLLTH